METQTADSTSPRRTAARHGRQGFALVTVMVLTGALLVMLLSLASLATTSLRLSGHGRDKAISLSLAEAGVDHSVDRLRTTRLATAGATWSGTAGAETLTDVSGETAGTYSVTVYPVSSNLVDVYSTGLTTNGKSRQVRARVNMSGLTVGDGAILSNGDVFIKGSVLVRTDPVGRGNADIRANRNIYGSGSAASVDGRVAASGTVSLGGVYTSDRNYPTGQNGAPRIPFPDADTVAIWKDQWYTGSRKTNLLLPGFTGSSGTASLSDALVDGTKVLRTVVNGKTTLVINGPAYINGNIDLAGNDRVVLQGDGPIYVTGNVEMTGNSVLVNSVTLIVAGTFKQVGSTLANPVYEAEDAPNPPALISLSPDLDDAINLKGTAVNNNFSIIYAVNGGIDMGGNVQVRGALVAGGVGCKITVDGNYTHTYPKDAVQNAEFAVVPTVISWIEM